MSDERLQLLQRIQKIWGMTPRNDSTLTKKYVEGSLEPSWNAFSVAHELVCVDAIYKTTRYEEVIEDTMRDLFAHLSAYKLPPGETWKIVRKYGPDIIKLYCLHESGQQLPECPKKEELDQLALSVSSSVDSVSSE